MWTLFRLPWGMSYFPSNLLWLFNVIGLQANLQLFLPVLKLPTSVTAATKSFIASTAGTAWPLPSHSSPCLMHHCGPNVGQSMQPSPQRVGEILVLVLGVLLCHLSSQAELWGLFASHRVFFLYWVYFSCHNGVPFLTYWLFQFLLVVSLSEGFSLKSPWTVADCTVTQGSYIRILSLLCLWDIVLGWVCLLFVLLPVTLIQLDPRLSCLPRALGQQFVQLKKIKHLEIKTAWFPVKIPARYKWLGG